MILTGRCTSAAILVWKQKAVLYQNKNQPASAAGPAALITDAHFTGRRQTASPEELFRRH